MLRRQECGNGQTVEMKNSIKINDMKGKWT